MDQPIDRDNTVRERIVLELVRRLKAMDPDQGDVIAWNEVIRHRLEDLSDERVAGDVCAVFDTGETYDYLASCTECTLTIQVEWWARVEAGDDGAALMERIRGNLYAMLSRESQLTEHGTQRALTKLVRPVRYDRDVDGPRVDYGGAFLELTVIYRHRISDPHSLVGGST
jgi:hypothetical protein